MERIIGMNARAALIELQKLTGKTIKTTRMLKLGRWNFEWETKEDGKTYCRKVRYFETPVTGANKEWCFDNCVVTESVEKEDGIDLTLTTPKGNERDVYIRFYKNRPYVAPVAEIKEPHSLPKVLS